MGRKAAGYFLETVSQDFPPHSLPFWGGHGSDSRLRYRTGAAASRTNQGTRIAADSAGDG